MDLAMFAAWADGHLLESMGQFDKQDEPKPVDKPAPRRGKKAARAKRQKVTK